MAPSDKNMTSRNKSETLSERIKTIIKNTIENILCSFENTTINIIIGWSDNIENSKKLKEYRISRNGLRHTVTSIIYVTCMLTVVAMLIFLLTSTNCEKSTLPETYKIICAVMAFIIGLRQWTLQRHEISFDKFYDRLDRANKTSKEGFFMRYATSHLHEKYCFYDAMLVYTELDNFEYVIEKYRYGYMSTSNAKRGLDIFLSRASSTAFNEMAYDLVTIGGYKENTQSIVKNIYRKNENLSKHKIEIKKCTSYPTCDKCDIKPEP